MSQPQIHYQGEPVHVRVEKLSSRGDDSLHYRLSIHNSGLARDLRIPIRFHEEHPEETPRHIHAAIHDLYDKMAEKAFQQLQTIYEEVGDYDIVTMHIAMRGRDNVNFAVSPIAALQSIGPGSLNFSGLNVELPETMYPSFSKVAINEKAMSLLKGKIGNDKFSQLNNKGYFEEQGKHGTYRFHLNNPHGVTCIKNVEFGDKARPMEWDLCIQSSVADMPKGDVILSRWMEFKADEDKFIRTANFRNVRTVDEAIN